MGGFEPAPCITHARRQLQTTAYNKIAGITDPDLISFDWPGSDEASLVYRQRALLSSDCYPVCARIFITTY
jgi:hypothetical protein